MWYCSLTLPNNHTPKAICGLGLPPILILFWVAIFSHTCVMRKFPLPWIMHVREHILLLSLDNHAGVGVTCQNKQLKQGWVSVMQKQARTVNKQQQEKKDDMGRVKPTLGGYIFPHPNTYSSLEHTFTLETITRCLLPQWLE